MTDKLKNTILFLFFLMLLSSCFITNLGINSNITVICIYFAIKWLTDYRKCTISYIECKMRGVPKEKGYLNQLLTTIIDLNHHKYRYYIYIFTAIVFIINYYKT